MLSFSSYSWLTVMAVLDSSEDRNTHSRLSDIIRVHDTFRSAVA